MPWGFPSHQGLILPLWARWPRRFQGLALCVGAGVPDIVDGVIGVLRGRLGQGIGHSLIGLAVLSVPVGLLVTGLVRKLWHRFVLSRRRPGAPRSWFEFLDETPPRTAEGFAPASFWPRRGDLGRESLSVFVGAVSHVFFDFISHETFGLLRPWYENPNFFPDFWRHRWGAVDLLVYRTPYPIAPHTLVWFVLSVGGAFLYVRILRRRAAAEKAGPGGSLTGEVVIGGAATSGAATGDAATDDAATGDAALRGSSATHAGADSAGGDSSRRSSAESGNAATDRLPE